MEGARTLAERKAGMKNQSRTAVALSALLLMGASTALGDDGGQTSTTQISEPVPMAYVWYSPSDRTCPTYGSKESCEKEHGSCRRMSGTVRPAC